MDNDLLVALHDGTTIRPILREGGSARLGGEGFTLRGLARFAMWSDSDWARDRIAHRITNGGFDWAGFRALLIDSVQDAPTRFGRLSELALDDLFTAWDAVGVSGDSDVEGALARAIALRVLGGEEVAQDQLVRLVTSLLVLGNDAETKLLADSLPQGEWSSAVTAIELAHPRFGGDHAEMLRLLNEVYADAGLARISMHGTGSTPFARLSANADEAQDGPLVTIIMSAWRPGEEIVTAVRSLIEQSYPNWELIVTDDGSGPDYDDTLGRLADLDRRIRLIRNERNAGTYVRRNEALLIASGQFVTFQDSDDWSHPQRIEVQVRDLLEHPERVGNVVRHARVTEMLSFATNRGMALGPAEPSIMFRRAIAIDSIGFYDSLRKGADREYRLRLETVTGAPVMTVGPEAPLQLMLASSRSLSGSDFAPGWMTSARVAYRTATDRFHALIKNNEAMPRIEFPQDRRAIVAPADFLDPVPDRLIELDMLVIADARNRRGMAGFIEQLAAEIRASIDAGLTTGILHSDTPDGRPGGPRLADEVQALVDAGLIRQVFEGDSVRSGTVVVRHAGAAQGHRQVRRPIEADKIVIVEDAMAGDVEGKTFSVRDVTDTVRSWFKQEPGWVSAEAFAALSHLQARTKREMVLLAATTPPGSRLRYEDQVIANPGHDTSLRFQRINGVATGADVVYGVGRMDPFLSLNARSTPKDRLDRTRRFVDELVAEGVGLVRTLYGALPSPEHPLEIEAAALLDSSTARYIVVDESTETPDSARTVTIPFANPMELFRGYPTRDRITGRLLCTAREALDTVSLGALKTFFLVRGSGLSLRVAGVAEAPVVRELESAIERNPGSVSGRIEPLSDAALIEEITAAELVIIPALASLVDYQLAMIALAFDRPVLVPAGNAATELQREVGSEWVITFDGALTAERLDSSMEWIRQTPDEAKPDLTARAWADIAGRYAHVFHEVVTETRTDVATDILEKQNTHKYANDARSDGNR